VIYIVWRRIRWRIEWYIWRSKIFLSSKIIFKFFLPWTFFILRECREYIILKPLSRRIQRYQNFGNIGALTWPKRLLKWTCMNNFYTNMMYRWCIHLKYFHLNLFTNQFTGFSRNIWCQAQSSMLESSRHWLLNDDSVLFVKLQSKGVVFTIWESV
jgi:hypothetical protein